MKAYYNEIDRYCCDWLSNLMDGGRIAPGRIDDRDIREVRPDDLEGYDRVHLFAGIAGWDHALNLAGWGDRPVWTGSCPCQPFSVAGKRGGEDDPRHLWPEFRRLVAECRPATVFGEQVASPLGRSWLASVLGDLEELAYAVAGADLCAAGVGAPHIRQRLWWVAHADEGQRRLVAGGEGREHDGPTPGRIEGDGELERRCEDRGLAEPAGVGGRAGARREYRSKAGDGGGMGEPDCGGRETRRSAAPAARQGIPLSQQVAGVAGWATPTSRDHKDGASSLENTPINGLLGRQVSLSRAPTEKRGQLNPLFSGWLMGFPITWMECAPRRK